MERAAGVQSCDNRGMTDSGYLPPSPFLRALIGKDTRDYSNPARAAELIALTQDGDDANRDWALMLLVHSELDTPEALAALVRGMDDDHHEASLEATIGVARLDPAQALPRVAARLELETIDSMTLEAAAYIADPVLLPVLEAIAEEIDDDGDKFADALREAIDACTRGTPPDWI
jgi:hypothetical protein